MYVKADSVPDVVLCTGMLECVQKRPMFVDCRFGSRERTTQISQMYIVCEMVTSLRVTVIRSEGIWSAGNAWVSVLCSSG